MGASKKTLVYVDIRGFNEQKLTLPIKLKLPGFRRITAAVMSYYN